MSISFADTARFIIAGLVLSVMLSRAALSDAIDGQSLSPGAYPAPDVEIAPLALTQARPNFANRNELSSFVDGVVEAHMKADHIAGAAIAIVHHDETVLLKAYGRAGQDRDVDPTKTLFRLGAISKIFTWIALMQLEEAGHISLDDPVNARLPQEVALPADTAGPILIRHLLDHKTGLEVQDIREYFKTRPNALLAPDKALVRYQPKQVHAAGLYTVMSDYGAALAGAIITHETGRNFPGYTEDNIFTPLGMTASSFREPMDVDTARIRGLPAPMPQHMAQDLSQGFSLEDGRQQVQPFHYVSSMAPALALSSTAKDMARFMRAFLNDGRLQNAQILRPETVKKMHDPLSKTADLRLATVRHGFVEYIFPGGYRGIGHPGNLIDFQSNLVMVPALNLGIFIATNTEDGHRLAMALPGLLLSHFFHAADTHTAPPSSPDAAAAGMDIDGTYIGLQRPYGKPESFFIAIRQTQTVSHDKDGTLRVTNPEGVKRYILVEPGFYREENGPGHIGFQQSGTGANQRMVMMSDSGTALRTSFIARPALVIYMAAVMICVALALLADSLAGRSTPPDSRFHIKFTRYLTPFLALFWLLYSGLFLTLCYVLSVEPVLPYPLDHGALFSLLSGSGGLAGLFTLAALVPLWPIWKHKGWRSAGWRIRHTLAVLYALCFFSILQYWALPGL